MRIVLLLPFCFLLIACEKQKTAEVVGNKAYEDGLSDADLKRLDGEVDTPFSPDTILLPNGRILSEYMRERGMKLP